MGDSSILNWKNQARKKIISDTIQGVSLQNLQKTEWGFQRQWIKIAKMKILAFYKYAK